MAMDVLVTKAGGGGKKPTCSQPLIPSREARQKVAAPENGKRPVFGQCFLSIISQERKKSPLEDIGAMTTIHRETQPGACPWRFRTLPSIGKFS